MTKNQELQRMNVEIDEYKKNLQKVECPSPVHNRREDSENVPRLRFPFACL